LSNTNQDVKFIRLTYKIFLGLFCFISISSGITFPEDKDSLITAYNNQAMNYAHDGNYIKAEELLLKVLDLKLLYMPDRIEKQINTYGNLGTISTNLSRFDKANEYYKKTIELVEKYNPNYKYKFIIYSNLSSTYLRQKNIDKGIQYFKSMVKNFDQNKNKITEIEKANFYLSIALTIYQYRDFFTHEEIKLFENPISLIKQSEKLLAGYPSELDLFYANISRSGIFNDDINLKESYFFKQKKIIDNYFPDNYYRQARYLENYARFLYYSKNEENLGIEKFNEVIQLILDNMGKDSYLLGSPYHFLSFYHLNQKNYLTSIEFAQRLLQLSTYNFSELNSFRQNPKLEEISDILRAYNALKIKSKALYRLYQQNNNIAYIEASHASLELAIKLLEKIRNRIDSETSQYLMSAQESQIYYFAQLVCNELLRATGDPIYKDLSYQINEKGKAFTLLSSIRSKEAIKYGNIPLELLERESELNKQISAHSELIFAEKEKEHPNQKRIETWESILFELQFEYDQLVEFFEEKYPKYYELKYDNSVISLDELQKKLDKNEVLIEYSLADSILYTYVIGKDLSIIKELQIDSTLVNNCSELYEIMTKQSFSDNARYTFENYTRLAYDLYKVLVEPLEAYIKGKNMIIIPDGQISYVPFDALLTKETHFTDPDYYDLPYMLYQNGLSLSYSATIHFTDNKALRQSKNDILAFAPDYLNLAGLNPGYSFLRQDDLAKLRRIPGVKEEVKQISSILNAEVYLDEQATETHFKEKANDFRILHLAMHTLLNDEDPLYSKLAFTQMVDTVNDGFLHTYEVYNMDLNAELTVLSSCNSGMGILQKGEGIQSLARGFTYAGCPSILMTLWEVADLSTVDIMTQFYHYLGEGKSKSEALRLSKIDYLKHADLLKSNPFFWSSFVIMGNAQAIYPKVYRTYALNAILLFIPGLIVLILYIRYRREISQKRL
jgi:CHAT domain-containing protein